MSKVTACVCFKGTDGLDYVASLVMTSEGTRGRYSARPEDCYEAEDPTWEITLIEGEIPAAAWPAFMSDAVEELIYEKATKSLERDDG